MARRDVYSQATNYDEMVNEMDAIDNMLRQLGLDKRFVRRTKKVDGKMVYYFTDLNTYKDYNTVSEIYAAINAAKNDFRTTARSRTKNVDPNSAPVTVKKGASVGKNDSGYSNANVYKTGQLRSEYNTKIKQYNNKRGATVLALTPDTSSSKVYMYIDPNGHYMECETFESAKNWADQDIIVVNGKPLDRNVYNKKYGGVKMSAINDDLDAKDYICHALSDDYFTSMTVDEFRNFFNS